MMLCIKVFLLCSIFIEDSYNVRFDLPSGYPYSEFLLEDSRFKHKKDYWVNRVYQTIRDGVAKFTSLVRAWD